MDNIYLINLNQSPDRLAQFHERNPHLQQVNRAFGIDGMSVIKADLLAQGMVTSEHGYKPGRWGAPCLISLYDVELLKRTRP